MTNWRTSAAYRIAFLNFGAFVLGLALLGLVIFFVMHAAFMRQLDAMIIDETQAVIAEYETGGARELAEAIHEREKAPSPARTGYAVFSPDGRRILGSLQTARPALGTHDIIFIDPTEGPDSARAYVVDLSPQERLVVAADREWIERIDKTVIVVFAFAFFAACCVGLGGAAIFGSYLRRRLNSISRSAEVIIRGNVRERMPVSPRHDEFDELSSTLNRMLDRVEGLVENLRQISNDVAHDLRTPLAHLRTRLENGLSENRSGQLSPVVLEEAIAQVDEVLSLFGAILRIAEVESGETRRFFGEVDLSGLLNEVAESYAPAVQDQGNSLLWFIDTDVKITGDRELIIQAVINLLENALAHTPRGTVIRLTLTFSSSVWRIQVADNGLGVPSSELGRIAKRFARLERSRTTAGYGLGLNLVSAVAHLHGGRLILKDANPGLVALIELPRNFSGSSREESEEISA
ncbi:MAG TPA: HAMP domain-containing sensor histidine kinase [Sphingomicrobium sp.]|nr:HAMP domain-containing sensor histidine kinase [Sphingomicrobium sp.]